MRENLSLANLNTCTRTCVHVGCRLFVYIPHRAIARHALLPLSTTPSSRLKNFSSSRPLLHHCIPPSCLLPYTTVCPPAHSCFMQTCLMLTSRRAAQISHRGHRRAALSERLESVRIPPPLPAWLTRIT